MFFVGIDWSEQHHDVCVLDELGAQKATLRIPEGVVGVARFHELAAQLGCPPAQLVIGIETDRGLLVHSLVAAGYTVFAINPLAVSRYRDRHTVSGAKSDPGDSKVLADLVRTDRQNHRAIAGDTAGVEAIKVLARAHQQLVWDRQRLVNRLRSNLREEWGPPSAGNGVGQPSMLLVQILEDAGLVEQLVTATGRRDPPDQLARIGLGMAEAAEDFLALDGVLDQVPGEPVKSERHVYGVARPLRRSSELALGNREEGPRSSASRCQQLQPGGEGKRVLLLLLPRVGEDRLLVAPSGRVGGVDLVLAIHPEHVLEDLA
jgi:hypothetical protein